MSAPIVYRWDDANAPVARGERPSYIQILTACLVNGYGAKAPAGWTREYANGEETIAVFRNNPLTGTGFYLRVDAATTTYAYTVATQGFEIMSGLDTGTNPFPASATLNEVVLSNAANATARPWVLVADDRCFYFFAWTTITAAPTDAQYATTAYFFGDFISRYGQADGYACAICGGTRLGAPNQATDTSSSYGLIHVARPSSGVVGAQAAWTVFGGGPIYSNYFGNAQGMAYVVGDPVFLSRTYINEVAAFTYRGYFPGYHRVCQWGYPGNIVITEQGGMSLLRVRHYFGGNYFTHAAIDVGAGFRP